MTSMVSDAVLARRAQDGETAAFDQLVTRHIKRAFVIAYRILRNREDAEDAVQDAFIAAYCGIRRFDATRPFAPWIGRIVARKGLNALQRRSLRTTEPLPLEVSSRGLTPHQQLARAQHGSRVRAVLRDLPHRQRFCVEMVELEGYSTAETARLLGISEVTTRWHLHRARSALRTVFSPDDRFLHD